MFTLIDLTHEITNDFPVFPGNQPTKLTKMKEITQDGYNSYRLDINMHTGTHLDSPNHMIPSPHLISKIPLEQFIGMGSIINVRGLNPIPFKSEFRDMIHENCILLLYTGHSEKFGTPAYYENYPVLDEQWSKELIRKKVKILGIDSPSPDKSPYLIHKELFPYDILLLENLTNLKPLLNSKKFEVIAFPLKIKAAASILRVVAKIWNNNEK